MNHTQSANQDASGKIEPVENVPNGQINTADPTHVEAIVEALQQARSRDFQEIAHTFIPTETITRGTVLVAEMRVESLRSSRKKHAQDALNSFLRWEETLKLEREAMWTLSKQQAAFRTYSKIERDRK